MKNLIILTLLIFSSSMVFAQLVDNTSDRWEDDGNHTIIGLPSYGEIKVDVNAFNSGNNKERLLRMKISDSDNFFSIDNISSVSGTFAPTLVGQVAEGSSSASALWLLGSVDENVDNATTGGAAVNFQARRGSNGTQTSFPIQHVKLFRWLNSGTELMSMDVNGRLGINSTSPSAKLHVNGTVRFQNLGSGTATNMLATDASGNVVETTIPTFSGDDDWYIDQTTNKPTSINDDIYHLGDVGVGGFVKQTYVTPGGATVNPKFSIIGDGYISGSMWAPSDARLKKNIQSISESANDVLMGLNGYSYEFKENTGLNVPSNLQYGFLAQEMEQVIPEAVADAQGTHEHKVVEKLFVLPFLVEGHKHQAVVIEAQNNRITALENEIAELKDLVETLASISGLETESLEDKIKIYPNPTQGEFNIEVPQGTPMGSVIEVYNLTGQKVYSQTINTPSNTIQVNLGDNVEGLYKVFLVEDGNSILSESLILK